MKNIFCFLSVFLFGILLSGAEDNSKWQGAAVLRPGDSLEIKVFRGPEFDRTVLVDGDGKFDFPLCGSIKALGLSPRQVGAELQKRLANQMADPCVDVNVVSWAPRTIYLLGEFKQGSISIQLPIFSPMTAMQAVSVAGGFTDFVDLSRVVVQRLGADGKTMEVHSIDASELYGGASDQKPFIMRPDDTLLAPRAAPVSVSGAVQSPGTFSIDTKRLPRCSELLLRAGGCVVGADVGKILIIRQGENSGEREAIPVSLRSVTLGNYEYDPEVKPGDSVFVGMADNIYVMGQVNEPKGLVLPPDSAITVSQAIALAGGLTPTASKGKIAVIRDEERIEVDLSRLYKKGDKGKDIELEYGDIVFVPESMW